MTESQELTLEGLVEEFEFLGDWGEQCRYLIELGEQLPDLPAAEKVEANRIVGCLSRVWLVLDSRTSRDQLWFRAKSDGRLVDGLIVIVGLLFNGKSPQEILDTDVRGPFKKLGLESHLAIQRRNGLQAMVQRVRDLANAIASNLPLPTTSASTTADCAVPSPAASTACEEQPNPSSVDQTRVTIDDTTQPPMPSPGGFDADAVARQFPALQHSLPGGQRIVYLDSASSSQKPHSVIDKEREVYEEYYANAYRGVYRFGDRVSRELESVREKVASFIGASSTEEVFFTSGTTMGMNVVANAWGRKFLRPGDEVLMTILEHHANIVPWQWVAKQTGAHVRFAPLTSDGQVDLDAFEKLINDRTRVISVSGLSNVLGTVMPLEQIAYRARDVGALLVVDGAQSVPHLPTDVVRQHIDFLAFSGHKLYGPSGVGVCYGRRAILEAMDPFLCGGHMIAEVSTEGFATAPVPAKFEAGTLPIAQAIALGAAIDFAQSLGLEVMHAHEQQLLAYAQSRLQKISGLRMYGPRSSDRGAIIAFTIDGAAAQDVASLLDVSGVCVRHGHHCTMPLHDWLGVPATIRASFAAYNTTADVDALVSGIVQAKEILKLA